MSALSNYLEAALIEHIFGNSDFSRPSTIYIALHTGDPGEVGDANEVSAGGYARQGIATGASSGWTRSDNAAENTATKEFPTASQSWGTITHASLWDAEVGGNCLFKGALAISKTVGAGDVFRFNAGEFKVSLD